jgi:hypothetical protein
VWQAILPAGGLSGRLLGFGSLGGAANLGCSRLSAGFGGLQPAFLVRDEFLRLRVPQVLRGEAREIRGDFEEAG